MWEPYKKGFRAYLQLERSMSDHSVEAYLQDLDKLTQFLLVRNEAKSPYQAKANPENTLVTVRTVNCCVLFFTGVLKKVSTVYTTVKIPRLIPRFSL